MNVQDTQELEGMVESRGIAWLALHGGFSMATIILMLAVLGLFFHMITGVLEHGGPLYAAIGCCLASLFIGLALVVPGKLRASIEALLGAILAIASAGLFYAIIFNMPEISDEFGSFAFRVDHLYIIENYYLLVFPYFVVQILAIVLQCGNVARVVATRSMTNASTPANRLSTRVDLGVVAACMAGIGGIFIGIFSFLTAKDVFLLGICWMLAEPAIMAIAGKKTTLTMMPLRSTVEPSRLDQWKPWTGAASLVLLALCLFEFENKIQTSDIAMLVISLPWFFTGIGISFAGHYGLSIAGIKEQPWTFWLAFALQAATSLVVLQYFQVLVVPGYFVVAGITFGWILAQVFMVAWPINERKLARGGLALLLILLMVLVIGLNILGIDIKSIVSGGYLWVVISVLGMAAIFWGIGVVAWIIPRHRKYK
ncbi:MAG TPA: hypothetical protein VKM55_08000 [Candidatus Lokiarchaeia archaeon]|nr:hypothetical protein [Candidatus Lokiarchaeia archaeon]